MSSFGLRFGISYPNKQGINDLVFLIIHALIIKMRKDKKYVQICDCKLLSCMALFSHYNAKKWKIDKDCDDWRWEGPGDCKLSLPISLCNIGIFKVQPETGSSSDDYMHERVRNRFFYYLFGDSSLDTLLHTIWYIICTFVNVWLDYITYT